MKLLLYQQRRGTRPTWLSGTPAAPQRSQNLLGAFFKAFPGPSTSSGHHGSPGPRAAQQSPEPDGAPDSR